MVQPDVYAYFKHSSHQELILFASCPQNVKTDITKLFVLYFHIGLFMLFSHLLTSFNINLSIPSSVYLSSYSSLYFSEGISLSLSLSLSHTYTHTHTHTHTHKHTHIKNIHVCTHVHIHASTQTLKTGSHW